jgi:hypothetical protein
MLPTLGHEDLVFAARFAVKLLYKPFWLMVDFCSIFEGI